MKAYERQQDADIKEFRDNATQEEDDAKERFEQTEKNIVTKRVQAFKTASSSSRGLGRNCPPGHNI